MTRREASNSNLFTRLTVPPTFRESIGRVATWLKDCSRITNSTGKRCILCQLLLHWLLQGNCFLAIYATMPAPLQRL